MTKGLTRKSSTCGLNLKLAVIASVVVDSTDSIGTNTRVTCIMK